MSMLLYVCDNRNIQQKWELMKWFKMISYHIFAESSDECWDDSIWTNRAHILLNLNPGFWYDWVSPNKQTLELWHEWANINVSWIICSLA